MTTEAHTQPNRSQRLGQAVGRFFSFLLRLFFVVALAIGVGAGVYYGLPWLYARLVQPVQMHTTQIELLNQRVDNVNTSVADARAIQDQRLTALETTGDDQRQRVGAAEQELATLNTALATETSQSAALESQIGELQTQLDSQTTAAEGLRGDLSELQPQVRAVAADLARLQQSLGLVTLQNGLLKARLQLLGENLGEARLLLVSSADEVKAFLQTPRLLAADSQAALLVRVASARALIESEPATALAELESVWAELDRNLRATGQASPP